MNREELKAKLEKRREGLVDDVYGLSERVGFRDGYNSLVPQVLELADALDGYVKDTSWVTDGDLECLGMALTPVSVGPEVVLKGRAVLAKLRGKL